jgi:hypothetical protein
MSEKTKNLRKKLPKKKNEKFSEKKNQTKKYKETFSLVPLSLPSLNCKANFFFSKKKKSNVILAFFATILTKYFLGDLVLCFAE